LKFVQVTGWSMIQPVFGTERINTGWLWSSSILCLRQLTWVIQELGADDYYLGKPFGPYELVARVKAVRRRLALT
jgi:hypothetical protein